MFLICGTQHHASIHEPGLDGDAVHRNHSLPSVVYLVNVVHLLPDQLKSGAKACDVRSHQNQQHVDGVPVVAHACLQ
jgi:hypothetical protein